jgi:LytS/YehU family sensor histidine kinase
VPLAKEVQLLENYLGLEQLRYGKKLQVTQDIAVQNDAVVVTPLILLPFAENCFKHGGSGTDGVFRVNIYLHADQQQLHFKMSNSINDRKTTPSESGGLGLQNIQKRLNLLYPGRHQLLINRTEAAYQVELSIKF